MKTADLTLEIFEAFAAAKKPLSLSELARLVDSPVSSCHGLLRNLQKSGYVYALDVRRQYYPTRRLFDIGAEIATHDPIVDRLTPILERLRDKTDETILLGRLQINQIVYLNVRESPQTISLHRNRGRHQAALVFRNRQGVSGRDAGRRAVGLPSNRRARSSYFVDHR